MRIKVYRNWMCIGDVNRQSYSPVCEEAEKAYKKLGLTQNPESMKVLTDAGYTVEVVMPSVF